MTDDELPFTDVPGDASANPELNASGFKWPASGERKRLSPIAYTIQPALTPEEWAKRQAPDAWINGADGLFVSDDDYEWRPVDQIHRHALAALALHGQAFGFTEADVSLLRLIAEGLEDAAAWRDLRSIADRIKALLPPGGA